jgi:magnesium transporter
MTELVDNSSHNAPSDSREAIIHLLQKHKVVEDLVHKQAMPRHDLVETLVKKQNLSRLEQILNHLPAAEVAQSLEGLPPQDQLFIWSLIRNENKEDVLNHVSVSVLEVIGRRDYKTETSRLKAFELIDDRLKEISITTQSDLANAHPIWVDMVNPSFEDRAWIGSIFGVEIPDPDKLKDLESSAKCFIGEDSEIHLRSDFLLDKKDESRNVAVAFILHQGILFSVRKEELPVFRLQRLRALTQSNYIADSKDLLLNLYAADVEYSADALEDVYRSLETAGNQVLNKHMTDEEAAKTLSIVAKEEDLNGRIRRNVLDTRRAVSFLMRSKLLEKYQLDESQQILRDIDSLDGHTAFLFDKINFLMDATVGFININQNKVMKRLTVLSVVFMPLNVIAGIGGMSEFSMMTQSIPWQLSYGLFTGAMIIVAWITYELLKFFEKRESKKSVAKNI